MQYFDRVLDACEEHKEQIFKVEETVLDGQKRADANSDEILANLSALGQKMEQLESRIHAVDAGSTQRDERMLHLLKQIAKKCHIAIQDSGAKTLVQKVPHPPPIPQAISVGLVLGEFVDKGMRNGKPRVHLQVQGILPGMRLNPKP